MIEKKNKEDISRKLIVKFFSEFMKENLPENQETFIKIVDFDNFMVLKGKSTSKEELDLMNLVGEFKKKYEVILPENVHLNTIDLIEYDCFPDKFELEEVNIFSVK
jgi:hypothetical protein